MRLIRSLVVRPLTVFALVAAAGSAITAQTASVGSNWIAKSTSNPGARYYSSSAYDAATGTVVYFGGQDSVGSVYNETWVWNGTTWTKKSPASVPPARYGAMMAYNAVTGNVVLFGGANVSGTPLSDTWTWDGTNWTNKAPATSPSGRFLGSMAFDAAAGNVVLFGGKTGSSSVASDTWTWNGTNWTNAAPTGSPSARSAAVMAYDAVTGTAVLYGGLDSNSNSNGETWVWNGSAWAQKSPASSPGPRYFSTAAFDAATGTVVLFGGSGSGGVQGDTWFWDGTNWTQQSVLNNPTARSRATSSYDVATNSVVLYGGTNSGSNPLSDTQTFLAGSFYAPSSNVGTAAAQTPVYFNITASGTLGTPQVLTQGTPNLDFTLGTGSTCTGTPAAGICSINVAFTPKAPGVRNGAVQLTDASNHVIATAFVSGIGNGPLATVTPGIITTVAGNGTNCSTVGSCGDGGAATSASISPVGVVLDGAGNVYFSDPFEKSVRRVDASTGAISLVVPTGTFSTPEVLAIDGAGNIYVPDATAGEVFKIDGITHAVTLVAGDGQPCNYNGGVTPVPLPCGDGGPATSAAMYSPDAVAFDTSGNFYISTGMDNLIRKVNIATGIISTVAGNGTACSSSTTPCGDGSLATSANLNDPGGLTVDAAGNIYIADFGDARIRRVDAASGLISTVAGSGNGCDNTQTCGDGGLATSAAFFYLNNVGVDAAGNLYASDSRIARLRKVTASTGIISSIAGVVNNSCTNFTAGCGNGGPATGPTLGAASGVAFDAAGNLYIADSYAGLIRKVSTTGGINFPTATAAGSTSTDGTQTATLSNIGNAPLVFVSQTESSSNFVLGNPNTGGCNIAAPLVAGGSCLVGATFAPQAGQSGLLAGNIVTTDNNLNVANSKQNIVLTGTTSATSLVLDVAPAHATTTDASVTLTFIVGYGATVDMGAATITVNGSATGVGTPSCLYKANHANCTVRYTGIAGLGGAANYTISVTIAAFSPYAQTTSTAMLSIVNPPSPGLTTPRLASITPAAAPAVVNQAKPVATVGLGGVAPVAVPAFIPAAIGGFSTSPNSGYNCPATPKNAAQNDNTSTECPK